VIWGLVHCTVCSADEPHVGQHHNIEASQLQTPHATPTSEQHSDSTPAAHLAPLPLLWGFDDIGFERPAPRHQASLTRHPRGGELVREFGFNFWLMWYPDEAGKWTYPQNNEFIRNVDQWCGDHHMQWMLNTLSTVWNIAPEHCVDERGYDWFCRADGRRYYQFPEEILSELGRCQQLLGLMYDEAEHHQNNANFVPGLDRPSVFNPAGLTLEQAADGHSRAVNDLVAHHRRFNLPLYTEHVTPVMFHSFSRGGVTAGTKVLKESWSPVAVACALGASIQYGKPLWITPDLWGLKGYPSHSVEQYRSSLLLAYHLGADCIYTESLCLPPTPGAPYAVTSLCEVTDRDYRVTPYGEVAKQFIHEYVPAHPRYFQRDALKPRVVIVRQEDGCYGQRTIGAPHLPDRLFGSHEWHSSPATEAWMHIWHLLSRGVVPRDSLYRLWNVPDHFFCPLDGVVVYDQYVGIDRLRDAEVIFLTGVGVSRETLLAISECVRQGATCVSWPALAPEIVQRQCNERGLYEEGAGHWLLTEDFLSPTVREMVASVIPSEDIIRYRFGLEEVVFRPVEGDWNRITAEVHRIDSETAPTTEPAKGAEPPPGPSAVPPDIDPTGTRR
jgi:hypothetical protein